MKKSRLFCVFIIIALALTLSALLCACGGKDNNEPHNENGYTASELKYVAEAGQHICGVHGVDFYKAYNGGAVVGYLLSEGTVEKGTLGPILVGRTADSVAYYTSAKCEVHTSSDVFEYEGQTYYFSVMDEHQYSGDGFMNNGTRHLSIYVCDANERKSAAGEIIKIADISKLDNNYGIVHEPEFNQTVNKDLYLFNDHYYGIFTDKKDWMSAEAYCESIGGHLVTIASANEDKFVFSLITDIASRSLEDKYFHIGASKKNDSWCWVTGEPFDFTNWGKDEPNGNGDYMQYYFSSAYDYSFKWDDTSASSIPFICEWESANKIGTEVSYMSNKITTVEQLKALSGKSGAYVLAADIDLSSEENWTPISEFSGVLLGNNHKILNLTINAKNVRSIGLFSELKGTVQDLSIEDANITAIGDVGVAGIVTGTNSGTIKNVTTTGNISPLYYSHVGGIVGNSTVNGRVLNCVNKATVKGVNNVAGIIGSIAVNAHDTFYGNINEGEITGTYGVGGIVGYLTCVRSNATYSCTNNTNKGDITGVGRVGGIIGEAYAFYERYNYNDYNSYFEMSLFNNEGTITGSIADGQVGGLIGKATRLTTLSASTNKGDIIGGYHVGGFVGLAPDTNIKAAGATMDCKITGGGIVGGFAGNAGVIEYAENNAEISSPGTAVVDGKTCAYVGGIAGLCHGLIGCTNNSDIDVPSGGPYVGGLAGYVYVYANGMINNNVNNGVVVGADMVGGIAGYVTCARSNATYQCADNINKNSVTGISDVGGIFGKVYAFYERYNYNDYNSYFSMSLLVNEGEVNGAVSGSDVGGLIGEAERLTVLTVSENKADVTGGHYVGGFFGDGHSVNIKAAGTANNNIITGVYTVGGIAGRAGIIENAHNNGNVIASGKDGDGYAYLGGIVGRAEGVIGCINNVDISISHDGKNVGGIAGYIWLTNINAVHDNVNNGKVSGADNVGGIVGYATCIRSNATYSIKNNTNKGDVKGNNSIGGIVGYIYAFYERYNYNDYNSYFEVTYCQNEGKISGNGYIGGIVGGYERLNTSNNLISTNATASGNILGQ